MDRPYLEGLVDGDTLIRKYSPKLVRIIEKASGYGGHSYHRVFEDFVRLSCITAESLPRHLTSQIKNKELAKDPPEIEEEWKRIMSRHRPEVHTLFCEGFSYLLEATSEGYTDLLGATYEALELVGRNNKAGIFFTPWNVCMLMAEINNPARDCQDRVKEALLHPDNIIGQALLLAGGLTGQGLDLSSEWAYSYFIEKLIPAAIPYLKLVTVMEPCCGSGRLILALASVAPRWAIDTGIIQFYGLDINPLCVEMCKTNVALYGINGGYIRNGLDLSDTELERDIIEPYKTATKLIKKAKGNGDNRLAEEIELELRKDQQAFDPSKYTQLEMFGENK